MKVLSLIRRYKSEDLDHLLDVWEAASNLAHPFLSAEFQANERHNIEHVYLPATENWVAVVDENFAGFIALIGNEIGGLFVHPAFQRRGIGMELVNHAQNIRGDLEVEVFKDNQIGKSFYETRGFVLLEEKLHEKTGRLVHRMRLASPSRDDRATPDALGENS